MMRSWIPLVILLGGCAVEEAGVADMLEALPDAELPPPPALRVAGACPGTVAISVRGASPGQRLAILSGSTGGVSQTPAGPCTGVPLDLGSPQLRVLTTADSSGLFSVSPTLGALPCTQSIQVLDVATCTTSAAMPLAGGPVAMFEGQVTMSFDVLGIPVSCPGEVSLEFDEGADPSITGTLTCAPALLPQPVVLEVEGNEDPLAGASGVIIDQAGTLLPWNGSFVDGPLGRIIEGSSSGILAPYGPYSLSFEAFEVLP